MAKVPSENTTSLRLTVTKWGLPKVERRSFAAMNAMKKVVLNIRQGNTAFIVVREP